MATLSGFSSGGSAITQEGWSNTVNSSIAKRKVLTGVFTNVAPYCTFRAPGTSSGYQVPSGKKFIIVAARLVQYNGAAGIAYGIASTSADAGFSSNTAPASGTHDFGTLTFSSLSNLYVSTAAYEKIWRSLLYVVPAGRYITAYFSPNLGYITLVGYEIDATATTI
jgi:hypothetical protein